jgi:hypothetical protein
MSDVVAYLTAVSCHDQDAMTPIVVDLDFRSLLAGITTLAFMLLDRMADTEGLSREFLLQEIGQFFAEYGLG